MKKFVSIIAIVFALVLTFVACGQAEPDTGESGAKQEKKTENTDNKSDVIVVVFSATGTTKGVAEKIAALTDADLREIVPAVPYTSADLNYGNQDSRATREQNDVSARPEIAEKISLDGYKTVYLGYPIWWGQAPRIMSTFVENHDFTGMTVIPFCTSRSGDIGQSDDSLADQAGSGNWIQGKRFPGSVAESKLREWIWKTGKTDMEKKLHLYINGIEVSVAWEDNESVIALEKLAENSLTVKMSAYGGFEQVGALNTNLPRKDSQATTEPGDIMLYSGDQVVIFYGSNTWSYTRLGKITGKTVTEIETMLGNGNVTATLKYGG